MQKTPFPFQMPIYWNFPADFTQRSQLRDSGSRHEITKDGQIKGPLLRYLKGEFAGLGDLTVLHFLMLPGENFQPEFLDLMLSKGADVNVRSLTGFSLLNTALLGRNSAGDWPPAWDDPTDLLDILLAHGAQANPAQCTITPLQSAIVGIQRVLGPPSSGPGEIIWDFTNEEMLKKLFYMVRKLLEHGAAVNRVSHDEANVTRIRQSCHIYFRQLEDSELSDEAECISGALKARGLTALYDTPLQMLDQLGDFIGVTRSTIPIPKQVLQEFYGIRKLLLSYGGKSLHLFPIEDLPGYVKEDMEEWKKSEDPQMATPSSTSILGHHM